MFKTMIEFLYPNTNITIILPIQCYRSFHDDNIYTFILAASSTFFPPPVTTGKFVYTHGEVDTTLNAVLNFLELELCETNI